MLWKYLKILENTSILLHVYEPIRNATGKLTAQKQKVVGICNEKKLNELRFRKK